MLNITPNEVESTGSSDAPKIEDGSYPAVISLIVDLGVQRQKKFDSKDKPDEACTDADYDEGHQLWYSFCLPTERYTLEGDDGPYERDQIVGKQYKMSRSDKSNLVIMYKALVKDGRTFGEMIGMPCLVNTGTTSGGKTKVVSVNPPMRGMAVGEPLVAPKIVTDEDYDNIDNIDLPDFLKDMINNRVKK